MFTIFLYLVLLALITIVFFWAKAKQESQDKYDAWGMGVGFAITGMIFCVLGFFIHIGCQYEEAISMPLQLAALTVTIDEQTALLADEATLGQGLEGMEIKREIQQTIRDKNELIANIELRRASLWYLFKP